MFNNNQSKGTAVGLGIFFFIFLFIGIFFLAFTEMGFDSEDSNTFAIFIPIFFGAFIPIVASINVQKRKKESMKAKANIQYPEPIYHPPVPVFQEKITSNRNHKRYCSYCGEKVTIDTIFCFQCGSKL